MDKFHPPTSIENTQTHFWRSILTFTLFSMDHDDDPLTFTSFSTDHRFPIPMTSSFLWDLNNSLHNAERQFAIPQCISQWLIKQQLDFLTLSIFSRELYWGFTAARWWLSVWGLCSGLVIGRQLTSSLPGTPIKTWSCEPPEHCDGSRLNLR